MSCDCGTTGLGQYLGKVGGQFGDKAHSYGMSAIGNAQKKFKSWTGLGDYTLKTNSLILGNVGGGATTEIITRSGKGGINITYREYLGNVKTHPTEVGGFNPNVYRINPAISDVFPWLAHLAPCYNKWRPNGIIFEFKSSCSNYATDSALGNVLTATEYNVLDGVFVSKAEMLNSAYSTETRMDMNVAHGIECDPKTLAHDIYYMWDGKTPLSSGDSARDYLLANFQIATEGGNIPVGTIVGSLYIHYDIFLMEEQLPKFSIIPNPSLGIAAWFRGPLSVDDITAWENHWNDSLVDKRGDTSKIMVTNDRRITFSPDCVNKRFRVDVWIGVPVQDLGLLTAEGVNPPLVPSYMRTINAYPKWTLVNCYGITDRTNRALNDSSGQMASATQFAHGGDGTMKQPVKNDLVNQYTYSKHLSEVVTITASSASMQMEQNGMTFVPGDARDIPNLRKFFMSVMVTEIRTDLFI